MNNTASINFSYTLISKQASTNNSFTQTVGGNLFGKNETKRVHQIYEHVLHQDLERDKLVMDQCIDNVKKVTFKN